MDPTLPNQQFSTPQGVVPDQENGGKNLLKIVSIFVFLILLILIVGILNYFNILPLSFMLPNQLGFLPHKLQEGSIKIENTVRNTGFGDLRPYAKLCKEFERTNSKISCEKAIDLALAQAPGKVKNVTIGPVRTSILSSSGIPERQTVNMWLIDIELTSPYFDKIINKEIHTLRVGYRLDDPNGMYEKAIN